MNNISVPTWLTPELIISIGILVVGLLSAIIAYRKLKPGLRVLVVKCTHKVRYAGPGRRSGDVAGTELIVDFEIRNTGGRTSIHEVEIRCKPLKQDYHTTEIVRPYIIIERGNQATYTHQFYISKRGVFETPLKCTFLLHYTHGKKKIKAKSSLRGVSNEA